MQFQKESHKGISEYAMSFHHYMNEALFNERWGYYSTGTVDIGKGKDFITYAENYAPILAERCFKAWLGMVVEKELTREEPFYVYEFGAGTGILASVFLKYVHGMSVRFPDTEWPQFFNVLRYQIAEISPALKKRQTDLLARYIELEKVAIHLTDARKTENTLPKGPGIVLSNELIDAMPTQKLQLVYDASTQTMTPNVMLVAATIPERILRGMIQGENCEARLEQYKKDMLEKEKRWGLPDSVIHFLRKENRWIVKKTDMQNLLPKFSDDVVMSEWPAPLTLLNPKEKHRVEEMLERQKGYIKAMMQRRGKSQVIFYLHTSLFDYQAQIPTFLTKGFVLTIDYAFNGFEYLFNLVNGAIDVKTFSKKHGGKSPLTFPGQLDITMPINFSDIDVIGEKHELKTIFFGTQDELGGIRMNDAFKVLIQAFNITSSKCSAYLLEGMRASVSVAHHDMRLFEESIFEVVEPYQKFQEGRSWIHLQKIFDWMEKQNYRRTNRACVSDVQTLLFGPTASGSNIGAMTDGFYQAWRSNHALSFSNLNAQQIIEVFNKFFFYKEIIQNGVYSEILLRMLADTIYSTDLPKAAEYMSVMKPFFIEMSKSILITYPHLNRSIISEKRLLDFNFITYSGRTEKSELTMTLDAAEEALANTHEMALTKK